MAIINGTVFLLSIGGTALPDQTEGSISISMETRDITTKDSNGFRELLEGVRSGSISVSGLVDDDGAGGAGADLFASLNGRAAVSIVFGLDSALDDYNYSCNAFCTSLEVSAATEDNVTYSASFEITGAITETVA
jgi:TP901-1 family phage major tail protein